MMPNSLSHMPIQPRTLRGFSMIDLLIGMTIGLLGLLAVSKVMVDFNKQRSSTVSLQETQGNGALALYSIERDLNQAGYGLMELQNCSQIQYYYMGSNQGALLTYPVRITANAGASDEIQVQYAYSSSGATSTNLASSQANFLTAFDVVSEAGFTFATHKFDLIVANSTAANICTMAQIYGDVSLGALNPGEVRHDQDQTDPNLSPYNPDTVQSNLNGATNPWSYNDTYDGNATDTNLAVTAGRLINLGPPGKFVSRRFRVGAGGLSKADFPSYAFTTMTDDVVFMRAQYGRDIDNNGSVDIWLDGDFALDNTNASQIKAVRIGVVVRSPLLEKDPVDQPATIEVLPIDPAGGPAITYAVPDTHFRYRAYSTIVPLKNVIWGATL